MRVKAPLSVCVCDAKGAGGVLVVYFMRVSLGYINGVKCVLVVYVYVCKRVTSKM